MTAWSLIATSIIKLINKLLLYLKNVKKYKIFVI